MPLPSIGQLAWGTPLNAEITADETNIANLETSVTNHENNNPADPHGDRAFTQALVSPITTGTNEPNGYVVLNGQGKIPLNLVPVGAGLTNWIDAIPDYNVPTNGAADASGSLNAALYQAGLTGGIVYVGSGEFALSTPLVIYPNTWLLCSPGAIFTRINLITPPFSMIQNFSSSVVPQNGNIRITGGTWDIATLASSGCMFTFANADFILIEDLGVVGYPDGHSPIGRLFGCSDVTIDNVQITASGPINSGRSNQYLPCFQVEELNVTNLPGCPNSVYLFQECADVRVRGCSHRGGVLTDSFGSYSAWTSFCGTKGTIVSGSTHSNIVITECYGSGFCVAAVEVINWSNLTCTGNFFSYPQNPYYATWSGITAQIETFIFDTNSPRSYPCTSLATCSNTTTETIVSQFTIPANDWIPGSTCYRHRHSGIISSTTSTDTITIHLRCGPTGTISDTIVETITVTISISQTNVPYNICHRGFDIDSSGGWHSCGFEVLSSAFTVTDTVTISNTVYTPTPGVPQYISHSLIWGHARSGQTCTGKAGCHERCNL